MWSRLQSIIAAAALAASITFTATGTAHAQFINNGHGPAAEKWLQTKADNYKLIYPEYFAPTALSLVPVIDTIWPWISHSFTRKPQRLPMLMYTHSQLSNGMVVWAPKRMELITTPPADTYADLWLKQLIAHESRHVAQLSAVRNGLTKILSYPLGQIGTSIGMACVSNFYFEGDAVLAETQFSEFGRALQPEFTVKMRGYLARGQHLHTRTDKWVCGSYKDFVPSIYESGYQVVAAGARRHGNEFWARSVEFAGKWPILIVPQRIYLRRHIGMGMGGVVDQGMEDLHRFWEPHTAVGNDYRLITAPEPHSYTTYSYPVITPGGDSILTVKEDFDTPPQLIEIGAQDGSGFRKLRRIGPVSSRPVLSDPAVIEDLDFGEDEDKTGTNSPAGATKLYWTEYKPHPVWEFKNYSVVRELDLGSNKLRTLGRRQSNYFITPINLSYGIGGRLFASVIPDSLGGSDIVLRDGDFREIDRLRLPALTSVHGLAWDYETFTLAFIALDQRGMWLGSTRIFPATDGESDDGDENITSPDYYLTETESLTAPSMVSVRDLSANGGRLFFSSIQSGKDEIHMLDLTTGHLADTLHPYDEYRLTTSSLGAYAPSARDLVVAFTSYTPDGYMIATTSTDTLKVTYTDLPSGQVERKPAVHWSRLPENTLNLPLPDWGDVPKYGEIPMTPDSAFTYEGKFTDSEGRRTRRYNKGLRMMNVHSWIPLGIDLEQLLDERELTFGFGATLFFQSAMGDYYGSAAYGWMSQSNWGKGSFTYAGLPVKITLDTEYGGGKQSVYTVSGAPSPGELDNYFEGGVALSAPLHLSGSGNNRLLQPYVSLVHYNSLVYNTQSNSYMRGYQKYNAALYWTSQRKMALRNLYPRLGYAVQVSFSGALQSEFGKVYSLWGRGYLPGIGPSHSVIAEAGAMYQQGGRLVFDQKPIVPRGCEDNYAMKRYAAVSLNYALPIWYPEGGINGFLYFKRVRANLFGDYARGDRFNGGGTTVPAEQWSYGLDLTFDFHLISSANPFGLTLTGAFPSDKGFYFGVGASLNL